MAGFPDSNRSSVKSRRIALICLILSIFSLVSCRSGNVLVVSDPYIEAAQGSTWKPSGRFFQLRAFLKGYRVISLETSSDFDISTILEIDGGYSDILIVSPLVYRELPVEVAQNRRVIAAGVRPERNRADIEFVYPDRITAFSDAGRLAGNGPGRVYGLFNSSTEERRLEFDAFLRGFLQSSGNIDRLIIYDIADSRDKALPDDFEIRSTEAETLVLFAGIHNLPGLLASGEAGIPVIGEYLDNSGIESERIRATIEDNPRNMVRVLLQQIEEPGDIREKSYQIKLVTK